MLNAQNPIRDAVIPADLMEGFKSRGHKVTLLVNSYYRSYPKDIISMQPFYLYLFHKLKAKLKLRTRLGLKDSLRGKYIINFYEQKLFYKTKNFLNKAKIKPDVIIVFFEHNFVTYQNIYELYKETRAPIYWLMYDMAPLTGGCHYAWECTGYKKSCGSCPALRSTNPFDLTYKNLQNKIERSDKVKIHIVAGSEYLYRQTKESTLFKNSKIYKTLTAFNDNIFRPVAKVPLREKNKLPIEKKIVFFGAAWIFDERKGIEYLIDSFKILKDLLKDKPELDKEILLLVAGQGFDKIKDILPFEHHYMGYLDNTRGIASAYQMADMFVCSSVEDSGPTMINQSIMCGTPVVSFEMGVALDLVISGKTGYRAFLKDSRDLAYGMYNLLTMGENEYEAMRRNCRELALKLYSPTVNIDNWLQILNDR